MRLLGQAGLERRPFRVRADGAGEYQQRDAAEQEQASEGFHGLETAERFSRLQLSGHFHLHLAGIDGDGESRLDASLLFHGQAGDCYFKFIVLPTRPSARLQAQVDHRVRLDNSVYLFGIGL